LLNKLKVNHIFNGPDKFEQAITAGQRAIADRSAEQFEIYYNSQQDEAVVSWDRVSYFSEFATLFGPGDVPGYLSDGDLIAMQELCKLVPDSGVLVEIGSFLGKSSAEWAKNLQTLHKNYRIICIDSFNTKIGILHQLLNDAEFDLPPGSNQLELFVHYTKQYPNIVPLEVFFNEDFQFDSTVDFVFEDSDHTIKTLTHALPFWWERLATGGILAGHDYTMQEVKTAVNTFSVLNNLKVNLFSNSSIWYIKK
jgi:hypothetical protein